MSINKGLKDRSHEKKEDPWISTEKVSSAFFGEHLNVIFVNLLLGMIIHDHRQSHRHLYQLNPPPACLAGGKRPLCVGSDD